LELEAAVSTVFASFLNFNLSFSMEFAWKFQHFRAGCMEFAAVWSWKLPLSLSFSMEFATFCRFGARTVSVTW
jgi:hypothetical protein